jgi:ribosome-associated protein
MEAFEMARTIARVLDDKRAQDIKLLKVQDLTVLADYFVIASGGSSTQVAALTGEVEFKLGEAGVKPLRVEGASTRSWVLLDYGTVVVHIFYPEAREYYALERMWADAEPVDPGL